MYALEAMSKDKRMKFLKVRCKITDKGVSTKTKQGGSFNGFFQRRKIDKDNRKDIVREVVTVI